MVIYEIGSFGTNRFRRLLGPPGLVIEDLMREFNSRATTDNKTHVAFCRWLVQSKGLTNAVTETHFYSPEN
jgi:hypothetical protein